MSRALLQAGVCAVTLQINTGGCGELRRIVACLFTQTSPRHRFPVEAAAPRGHKFTYPRIRIEELNHYDAVWAATGELALVAAGECRAGGGTG